MARRRRLAPKSSGKFVRAVILPLSEKDHLSGTEEVVERYPTCCGRELVENSDPLQAPQRRRSFPKWE